jgi:hypothetical protein
VADRKSRDFQLPAGSSRAQERADVFGSDRCSRLMVAGSTWTAAAANFHHPRSGCSGPQRPDEAVETAKDRRPSAVLDKLHRLTPSGRRSSPRLSCKRVRQRFREKLVLTGGQMRREHSARWRARP